jgi:hydroxymethylbilane synthase
MAFTLARRWKRYNGWWNSFTKKRRNERVGQMRTPIVIGTRASALALVQANMALAALQSRYPEQAFRLEHVTTKGDLVQDRPLSDVGGQGLFVTAIEEALRAGRIDLAVHSAKDLPALLAPDMRLAAFPERADPRDVLIARDGRSSLADLPDGAILGTGSARRACQIHALRPDLVLRDLRGNVDTRLRKLREGQYDAIILAKAGVERLELDLPMQVLDLMTMIPAVAQGALAIEIRTDDTDITDLLAFWDHAATRITVTAERAFLAGIGGGCHTPLGAWARLDGDELIITGMLGNDAGAIARGERRGVASDAAQLGADLAAELLASGVMVMEGARYGDE